MAHQVRWSPRAASNFEDICNYIARDSELYAMLFAQRVIAIIEAIPEFPRAGRMVPEYEDENLRERIYSNYRIVYRLQREVIEIVAIAHSAKKLDHP